MTRHEATYTTSFTIQLKVHFRTKVYPQVWPVEWAVKKEFSKSETQQREKLAVCNEELSEKKKKKFKISQYFPDDQRARNYENRTLFRVFFNADKPFPTFKIDRKYYRQTWQLIKLCILVILTPTVRGWGEGGTQKKSYLSAISG